MLGPLGIEFAGAFYDVNARGNRAESIYEDDGDRRLFVDVLGDIVGDVVQGLDWRCHAYRLITSHDHLAVETADGNLGRRMRQLNGVYTEKASRQYHRPCHRPLRLSTDHRGVRRALHHRRPDRPRRPQDTQRRHAIMLDLTPCPHGRTRP